MEQSQDWRPEIVVGIDFGMTCTGVAYSIGPHWAPPSTIQHWPGRVGYENRNKVTTAVAYNYETGNPVSWGFLVNRDDENLDVRDLFKLYLDPVYKDDFPHPPTVEEARRWYRDYLTFIYKSIKDNFDEWFPRWTSKNVEFLFSVPTTWKNPAMIAQTEAIIKSAGFGTNPKHKMRISLTEAESAAVYAAKQHYDQDDVILVCDVGGGTSDVNILKVSSSGSGNIQLKPLTWVEGESIGSTLIDYHIRSLIVERLQNVQQYLQGDLRDIADKAMAERFETFKCSFGKEANKSLDLLLSIPGMPPGLNFEHFGIFDSKIKITQNTMKKAFDEQVHKIFIFLDREFEKLQMSHPGETVNYIVLSGGLGDSKYFKHCLRQRYELGGVYLPNAEGIKIVSAVEPQLAVVHGIVMNRCEELKHHNTIYNERCCPNSYGIVVRQPYNPLLHQGEEVVVDTRDKQKWAENQIEWLIKQGQLISSVDGVRKRYRLKLNMGKEKTPWRTTLVMSSLPISRLPKSTRADGVRPLCSVESTINASDMKLMNKRWYDLGRPYWLAEFELKVDVGPADLKFQLLGKNGQLNVAHEKIKVEWNNSL